MPFIRAQKNPEIFPEISFRQFFPEKFLTSHASSLSHISNRKCNLIPAATFLGLWLSQTLFWIGTRKHKFNFVMRFGIIPKNAKLLNFAPYYVTKDGMTVFSMITGKPLKQALQRLPGGKTGSLQVWLRHTDGTTRWHKVHRLVASLFVVNYQPSSNTEVSFRDNNRQNTHYTNLYWASHSSITLKAKKKSRLSVTFPAVLTLNTIV